MLERGAPVPLSCPECSGPLWRAGSDRRIFAASSATHSTSTRSRTAADDDLDRTLWAAIRMFEQRVNISRMLARAGTRRGRHKRAQLYESRASESQRHAQALRELHQRRRLVLDQSEN